MHENPDASGTTNDDQIAHPLPDADWRNQRRIRKGIEAWTKLRNPGTEAVPLNRERQKKFARYMKYGTSHTPLERDFTTDGPKGELKCPFATMVERRMSQEAASTHQRPSSLPTPPDIKEQLLEDPIAAEFHAQDFDSPPASANGSMSKCPIRFLENHSPEEVAQYFENHKHEIPRSHEVCVKRYQSNAESIRQLDAKYGNLVNMIQGLGKKHKPMLPTEEEEISALEQPSIDKVAKWAENCAEVPEIEIAESVRPEDEIDVRSGHFERPLQEVRLGESPSRPWGIRVPLSELIAHGENEPDEVQSNTAQSIAAAHLEHEIPVEAPQTPSPARCPFGHGAPKPSTKPSTISNDAKPSSPVLTEPASTPKLDEVKAEKMPRPSTQPHEPRTIYFTGPVFFGYSAEQASALIKNLQQT